MWLVAPAVAGGIAWNRTTDTVRCSCVCNLKQGKVCRAVEAVLVGKLVGAQLLHSSTSAREDVFVRQGLFCWLTILSCPKTSPRVPAPS